MSKTQIILDNINPVAFASSSMDYTNYYPGDSAMFISGFEKMEANYAALDGNGFSLMDETMRFALLGVDYAYIGNLSKTVTDANGQFSNATLTITFSNPIDLKEGLQIWFSPADVCVAANYIYEFEDGTQITFYDPGATSPVVPETSMEEYEYGLLKKIYFTPIEMYTRPTMYTVAPVPNSFLRIIGFHYGFSVDLGTNCVVGPITVYHELAMTSDDAPCGTIDLNLVADPYTTIPQEGQTMTIISSQTKNGKSHSFTGKYTIDSIEQTSKDVYHITGYDDIAKLESYTWDGIGAAPSYITSITGVPITYQSVNDPTYHYNYIGYMEEDKTTCRQWLAMYCTCQLCGFTTFNSADGIYQVRWDTDGRSSRIDPDEILGEAKYIKREKYAGVVVEMDDDDEKIVGTASSGIPQILCSQGWYRNQSNVFLRLNSYSASLTDKNAAATRVAGWMCKYINGAEVECTIIYDGITLGQWVFVETPYNGMITGVVKSIELSLNSTDTAKIVVREAVRNGT